MRDESLSTILVDVIVVDMVHQSFSKQNPGHGESADGCVVTVHGAERGGGRGEGMGVRVTVQNPMPVSVGGVKATFGRFFKSLEVD